MEVKEAVSLAKQYLLDLFSDEKIENLGLEEVEYQRSEKTWAVTLGFSRPWDARPNLALLANQPPRRSFKTVIVLEPENKVIAVRDRTIAAA